MDCLWHPDNTNTCRALDFSRHFGHALPPLSLLPATAAKEGRADCCYAHFADGKAETSVPEGFYRNSIECES